MPHNVRNCLPGNVFGTDWYIDVFLCRLSVLCFAFLVDYGSGGHGAAILSDHRVRTIATVSRLNACVLVALNLYFIVVRSAVGKKEVLVSLVSFFDVFMNTVVFVSNTSAMNSIFPDLVCTPVSYTHLTLPTNREV